MSFATSHSSPFSRHRLARLAACAVWGAALCLQTSCETGDPEVESDPTKTVFKVSVPDSSATSSVAGFFCPDFIAALAVPTGHSIQFTSLVYESPPGSTPAIPIGVLIGPSDTFLTLEQEAFLTNALVANTSYDPQIHDLFFIRTTDPPQTCAPPTDVLGEFQVLGPSQQPVALERFITAFSDAAGSSGSLAFLDVRTSPVSSVVPTTSQWGLLILVVSLLVLARIRFGARRESRVA